MCKMCKMCVCVCVCVCVCLLYKERDVSTLKGSISHVLLSMINLIK